MKKITYTKGWSWITTFFILSLGLFIQADTFAQCVLTPGFPDPPASCTGPSTLIFTEDFNSSSFGVFTEDPAPGGTNDLTVSTNSDTPSTETGPECTAAGIVSTDEEFIFLESSNAQTGEVHCMSTTIDLTGESAPLELSFWYYMHGSSIGELTVNVDGNQEFIAGPGQIQTGQTDPWIKGVLR